jgi:FkbM family methyltransferase
VIVGEQPAVEDASGLTRLKGGLYEPLETNLFRSALRPGMIVLDIGANVGLYSLVASRVVAKKGSSMHEPDSRNAHYLSINAALNGCTNIRQFDMVSDEPGKACLWVASKPFNSSMFLSMGDTPITATVEVETVAVDDVLVDEGRLSMSSRWTLREASQPLCKAWRRRSERIPQ